MRLNGSHRQVIIESAVNGTFKKEEERLAKMEDKLCRKLYNVAVSLKTRRALEELSEVWKHKSCEISFNIIGRLMKFQLLDKDALPTPPEHGHWHASHRFAITDPELLKEAETLQDLKADLKKRKTQAENSVKALVNSVGTFKTLRETWPEGKAFYDPIEGENPVRNLPAVQISQLNALLGLRTAA